MSLYLDISNNAIGYTLDEDAVRQSLQNLLMTNKGERVFNPNVGLALDDTLFELEDYLAEADAETKISAGLAQEPRIQVNRVIVKSDPVNYAFDITIYYNVKGLGVSKVFQGTITRSKVI